MFRLISFLLLVFVCCPLIRVSAYAENEEVETKSLRQLKFEKNYKEYAKGKNQDILLYGQVVDFENTPVSYAKLSLSIRFYPESPYADDFRSDEIVADEQGRFVYESYGELLTIKNIKKKGYQYSYEYNSMRNFNFARNLKRRGPGFEKDKPMVFKVRKKGQPSLVTGNYIGFDVSQDKPFLLDLFRSEGTEIIRLYTRKMMNKDWHPDMKVSLIDDGDDFNLVMEMLDPDSGMIVDKKSEFFEEMSEAPVDGYRSKLVLPLQRGQRKSLRIYVKNEGGLFYSKLKLRYVNDENNNHVGFGSNCETNMAGGRGMEYSPQLISLYREQSDSHPENRITRQRLRAGEQVFPMSEVE